MSSSILQEMFQGKSRRKIMGRERSLFSLHLDYQPIFVDLEWVDVNLGLEERGGVVVHSGSGESGQ